MHRSKSSVEVPVTAECLGHTTQVQLHLVPNKVYTTSGQCVGRQTCRVSKSEALGCYLFCRQRQLHRLAACIETSRPLNGAVLFLPALTEGAGGRSSAARSACQSTCRQTPHTAANMNAAQKAHRQTGQPAPPARERKPYRSRSAASCPPAPAEGAGILPHAMQRMSCWMMLWQFRGVHV
jgi:hypothetical protein